MSALLLLAAPDPAAAAPAALTCQQAGPCIIVQVVSGSGAPSTQYVYAGQLDGNTDVTGVSYPVHGSPTGKRVDSGISVAKLLDLVDVDTSQVTYAEVDGPDAYGRHVLSAQELGPAGSNGFTGGLSPAFWFADGRTNYIRPERDADDANGDQGPDNGDLDGGQGGALALVLHTSGKVLDVAVTATPTDATQRSWTLSTDQPAGASFGWVLPDGTSSDAVASYTFPAGRLAGSYPVAVAVETADGSFGWGQTVLSAGDPPQPSAAPTSGTGGSGSASAGPTKKPTRGASGQPRPDPSGGTGTAEPTATSSTTTAPTATASATTSASAAPTLAPTASAAPSRSPSASSTPTPSATSDAEVQGLLLSAGEPVDPGDPSAGVPTSEPPPLSEAAAPIATQPWRVATWVWVVAGGLALLLGGAASESARLRARLRRWRSRRWRWSRMGA